MTLQNTLAALLLAVLIGVGMTSPTQAAWVEDFNNDPAGSNLQDVAGWAKNSGASQFTWTIRANGGSGDSQSAFAPGSDGSYSPVAQYTRSLTAAESVTTSGESFSFQFDTGGGNSSLLETGYSMTYRFGEAGTGNYFELRFLGQDTADLGAPAYSNDFDNEIRLSDGSGGYTSFDKYNPAGSNGRSYGRWEYGQNMLISISNIQLSNNDADALTASITVEVEGRSIVTLDGVTMTAEGMNDGDAFDKIDYVSFTRSTLNASGYQDQTDTYFDDFSLTPEPGTMTLLALGGLLALRRRRR